ncbi:MAG TPA: penicillin acylase family protein [Steroidobacteraceae bacterium]|nr:penicillin acylase family protein [Steroidobacteraceae bacterium]
MSRPARILAWMLGTLAALAVAAVAAAWLALRASLPTIEGEATVAGLGAAVTIERDAAGVPVIRGATRTDVARATGYAHAQDRLFQMDLLRRTGAGELAALLGAGLVGVDRKIRLHQFRARAREVVAALEPGQRALLEAYAAGANAGAAALGARPFEYLLLGQAPEPWRAEDCILVVHAMWIDLQGLVAARDELRRDRLAVVLPEAAYRFIVEPEPTAEAALDGSRLPQMPIPTAAEYDLRKLDRGLFERLDGEREKRLQSALEPGGRKRVVGSNNWAVAGSRSRAGGALLANDMHLGLNVPNIWYRARLVVEQEGLDVSGVSLPGVPLIVAGSNRSVAWGFTNSYGDFQDVIRLEPGPDADSYLTPAGPRRFELATETLSVAGGDPETLVVRRTVWGPVIESEEDVEGRDIAVAWTAHRPGATDMELLRLERATDLDSAAAIIGGAGMPAQNVMIADKHGRIGWVLSGRLPRRHGIDPLRPSGWHTEGSGWDGWIPRAESPRLLDPAAGIAWSANARVVGGAAFALIGNGDYASAARARQIRDRLSAFEQISVSDMLAIQLDDRADYVASWQPVLERALERAGESEAARLVAGWSGHAAIDDAGYRLLRDFEQKVTARAFETIAVEAIARWPDSPWQTPEPFGEVALRLVQEQPPNLLDPRFADWDAWLSDVATDTVRDLPEQCIDLAGCTWGKVNTLEMRHPISAALPIGSGFLDMPKVALPGDWSTPRAQGTGFGASERFAVSPGREGEGYLHMPGGQSGHPLSPFYRAGHSDWAEGRATAFLPGPAAHVLTLEPPGG